MNAILSPAIEPVRALRSTEKSKALSAPLFTFIAEAQDGHQLQFIHKRIQNTAGLATEDLSALEEAWRNRFAAINTIAVGSPKPRWKNLL